MRIANRLHTVKIDKITAAYAELVAGIPDRKIRVTSYELVAAGAVTAKFQQDDGSSKTDLTGAMSLITGTPVGLAGSGEAPVLQCDDGQDLGLVLGGAVQVSGHLTYTIEPTS